MNKPPDERKEERARTGQNWDNEGGDQSSTVPQPKVDETEQDCEESVKPEQATIIPKRPVTNVKGNGTLFSSTYFMKLWNAGSRTLKAHRPSAPGNLLSINPDHLRDRKGFSKESFLTLARNRDR